MNMQLNARFSSDNLKDALVKTHGNVDGAIDALLESKRGTVEEEERRKKRERGDDGRGERSHRFELREKRERERERER